MARRAVGKSSFKSSFFFMLIFAVIGFGAFILNWTHSQTCANTLSCKEPPKLEVDNGEKGVFAGQTITPPSINLAEKEPTTNVLGEAVPAGEKHIYVDLTTQTLTAYEGSTVIMQTLISSGKWFPTPTGDFKIWSKYRSTKMSGGSGADYYYLPNVPFVMFFSGSGIAAGRGFSLHGTYWHNNFGHPMSHGCVNMRTSDAQKLFYWADSNTIITIYGKAP